MNHKIARTRPTPGLGHAVACISTIVSFSCGSGSTPLTETDYCTQRATRECAGVALQCSASMTACVAARTTACSTAVAVIHQSALVRPFRPENIAACVNKAQEVYSKTPITPADLAPLDVLCNRVFSGRLKAGDACTSSDYECDVGLICDPVAHVCAKQVTVTGMYCGNPGETCPTGKFCSAAAGGTRQCLPRAESGESCAATPCVETLRCSTDTMKCVDKAGVAEPCMSNDDCAAIVPYCDPFYNNTCDRGFEPTRSAPECADFGGTPPGGTGGAGGAGGATL